MLTISCESVSVLCACVGLLLIVIKWLGKAVKFVCCVICAFALMLF